MPDFALGVAKVAHGQTEQSLENVSDQEEKLELRFGQVFIVGTVYVLDKQCAEE